MKKKILLFAVIVITLISSTVFAAVGVQLNGQLVDFTDEDGNVVNAEIINGRTMVPMRKLFEIFNAKVEWDGTERKVTAVTDEKIITLKIDNVEATIENILTKEVKNVTLDSAPVIINGRTLVPLRFIAESLDKQVGWDNENRCAIIIDYGTLEESIRVNAPTLVEYIEMEKDNLDSFKLEMQASGNIAYKDRTEKVNNENVKVSGDATIQKNKDNAYSMDLNLKFTGDGEIIDALKEEGYASIILSVLGNGETAYIKSNLIEESNNKKWVDMGETLVFIGANDEVHSIAELVEEIKLDESTLTINSYRELTAALDMLYMIFGEDNFKTAGTTSKRFELNLDVVELLNNYASLISNQAIDLFSEGSMNAKIVMTYKDKKPTKTTVEFNAYIEDVDTKESIQVNLDIDMAYSMINNTISINMPKKSEITEVIYE